MAAMTPKAREALEAEDKNPKAERHSIPCKGGNERCTVIGVDLAQVGCEAGRSDNSHAVDQQ